MALRDKPSRRRVRIHEVITFLQTNLWRVCLCLCVSGSLLGLSLPSSLSHTHSLPLLFLFLDSFALFGHLFLPQTLFGKHADLLEQVTSDVCSCKYQHSHTHTHTHTHTCVFCACCVLGSACAPLLACLSLCLPTNDCNNNDVQCTDLITDHDMMVNKFISISKEHGEDSRAVHSSVWVCPVCLCALV